MNGDPVTVEDYKAAHAAADRILRLALSDIETAFPHSGKLIRDRAEQVRRIAMTMIEAGEDR